MMRAALSMLAAALLSLPAVHAQQAEAAAAETHAELYARLTAEYRAAERAHRARVRAVQESDAYAELSQAGDRDGMRALLAGVPPVDVAAFLVHFQLGAAVAAGTDDAVDFLTWIAIEGRSHRDVQAAAIEEIVAHHLESPRIQRFVENVPVLTRDLPEHDAGEILDAVLERTQHAAVRAHALYARATGVLREKDASDEAKAAARADLEAAKELAAGTLLGLRLAGPEFARNHLQIGMVAPDIEGADLDGVPFKLSDYRGKVVVLDFWGDW